MVAANRKDFGSLETIAVERNDRDSAPRRAATDASEASFSMAHRD